MCATKFIVYILFALSLYIERSVSCSDPTWNCSASQNSKRRSVREVGSISGMAFMPEVLTFGSDVQSHGADIQKQLPLKSHRANHTVQSDPSISDDDDSEFHFLITGGYRPPKNELVKYVVSLRTAKPRKFFGDNHFCGGSLISTKVVLTAAHCLFVARSVVRPSKVKVVLGTPRRLVQTGNTQELKVSKVIAHPKYSATRLYNDVGLLILKNEATTDGKFVDVIPLADIDPPAGTQCTVVGWGTVIQYGPLPDEAVNADVAINTNSYCSRLSGYTTGMLCASNANDYQVDSCQGDSGGPLICNGKVFGVVSFGFGCGVENSAGIYTDVNHFRKWIEKSAAPCNLGNGSQLLLLLIALAILSPSIDNL